MGFFLRTQERVRNSRGKRAIVVRTIEVLLYHYFYIGFIMICAATIWTTETSNIRS